MNKNNFFPFAALFCFAIVGVIFSGISTYDFIAHLDRQMHAISCSFVPGLEPLDLVGASGCFAAMMSPYSSIMREAIWGGIPIALPSLSVFAYLAYMSVDMIALKKGQDPAETGYAIAASLLPLVTSIVYYWISIKYVGAVCKLCVGVYFASAGVFISAIVAHIFAMKIEAKQYISADNGKSPFTRYLLYFFEGVLFVAIPIVLYVAFKPQFSEAITDCGRLAHPEDKYGIMSKYSPAPNGIRTIEILDPLCLACKGFRDRLKMSSVYNKLDIDVVLFPLDKECNWMVTESLHPGSCAVSEAALCAGDDFATVLNWSLNNQPEIRELALEGGSKAVYTRLKKEFPKIASCVNRPQVRSKINKSLRWIVSNSLPVQTPQFYVNGEKLCDEDTDLGLEYTLFKLIGQNESAGGKK